MDYLDYFNKSLVLEEDFTVPYSYEEALEDDDVMSLVLDKNWEALLKLFSGAFSEDARYINDKRLYDTLTKLEAAVFNLDNDLSDSLGQYFNGYLPDDCFTASGITKIIIPSSIRYIGTQAFYHCEQLKDVTLPESVISLGNGAFSHCYKLTSIKLPRYLLSLGERCFYHCFNLEKVELPRSLTRIPDGAFDTTQIKFAIIPEGVKTIGDYAFISCEDLWKVSIPSTCVSIGRSAFHNCPKLTQLQYSGTKEGWNKLMDFTLEQVFGDKDTLTIKCLDGDIVLKGKE